jgi:chromosome segregation protein
MASATENTPQARLERAEAGWRKEYAAHERTLDNLHAVSRDLRDARSRIEALEGERGDLRADVERLEERLARAEEKTREKEAEINELRADIDEGASTLQSVLDGQNDIRAERDAAMKRLEGIQANDQEMRELREEVASRIARAEEEVKVERAKVAAAEGMREMSIKEIKTLRDSASETAAEHANAMSLLEAKHANAFSLLEKKVSGEELEETRDKLRSSKREIAKLNKAARKRNEEIQKLKGGLTAHASDKDEQKAEMERLRRELEELRNPPHQAVRHFAPPVNHYGWDRPAPVQALVNDRFGPAASANVEVERHHGW